MSSFENSCSETEIILKLLLLIDPTPNCPRELMHVCSQINIVFIPSPKSFIFTACTQGVIFDSQVLLFMEYTISKSLYHKHSSGESGQEKLTHICSLKMGSYIRNVPDSQGVLDILPLPGGV